MTIFQIQPISLIGIQVSDLKNIAVMESGTNVTSRNWKSTKISVKGILPTSVTYLLEKES